MISDSSDFSVSGQIADVVSGKIFPGRINVSKGRITTVEHLPEAENHYIVPGLIDAHVHIESSMLLPSEFARLAVVHGTTATVSDPHEIANVLGMDGVKFMIENGRKVNFGFYFGAPSCVPATPFETSGANLGPEEVEEMLKWPEIYYLSEMMNFPGVINGEAEVMKKLELAKYYNKPVDGHAPGLLGDDAVKYASAGISTDHECFTTEEAIDKINAGMKVLIREGSAARNFEALIGLISDYPEMIMLCSDDKHPDDLVNGHINLLIKRALSAGYNFMDVIRSCTLNPVRHYKLESGLLQKGDRADFVVIDNLTDFNIQRTFINGVLVAESGKSLIKSVVESSPNRFDALQLTAEMLRIKAKSTKIKVQQALEGQLITEKRIVDAKILDGCVVSDTSADVLKMMVMNRYNPAMPAVDFVSGFGLKHGAIASTVAHDSHNIIAVGADDESMVLAVNALIDAKGGIAVASNGQVEILPLPVAGIMSPSDGYEVAIRYSQINQKVLQLGTKLNAPFMTLSFMALLVIPALKLSDKGLFDGNTFAFTELFELS
ncbi:MAG: adenine deaminase [Bacteroidetes bacterium HGW-Bacteroidetes-11]|jgi:adenine deaminase|nr:MAG: adenine deaminase [Bacteroidetes bacterium HGW-Bacteroidetes-11]